LQEILRGELGFDGVIFSDDLSMAAAHSVGTVEKRAELALTAGCDMILVCNNPPMAEATLRWLENQPIGDNSRLQRMQGRTGMEREKLLASAAWREARQTLTALADTDGR
jgi:beta-N-acetylhexosaminidase